MTLRLATLTTLLALMPMSTPKEASAAPPSDAKYFKLVNLETGKCLDPAAWYGTPGKSVGVYACQEFGDQTFYQTTGGGPIKNILTDVCLDAGYHDGAAGRLVGLYTCESADDQKWTLGSSTNWSQIKNGKQNKCLEIDTGSNNVKLADCSDTQKQKWMVVYTGRR